MNDQSKQTLSSVLQAITRDASVRDSIKYMSPVVMLLAGYIMASLLEYSDQVASDVMVSTMVVVGVVVLVVLSGHIYMTAGERTL